MSPIFITRTAGTAVTLIFTAGLAVGCGREAPVAESDASDSTSSAAAESSPAPPITPKPPTTMNVPGVGQVVLDGAIAEKYRQKGGEAGLGLPAAPPKQVGNGTVQAFAKGDIYYSPATGPHLMQGQILRMYLAQGGPTNPLGFPTTDEFEVCGGPKADYGGWGTEFENGYIWWLNWGDAKRTFAGYITGKDRPQGSQCRPPG